ncbi:hypothetical protein DFH08DRAFT_814038 [Mycena albidolilacea]|uniref:Uncharacterized protein n=1 Tax=Mycena albidolilacea TaxID=1033008 RepID=A0AAD6ZQ21_9AGAR|nr:hypothetical protein DFH08DRAFT_814038 [Mycena albidolilacea]
MLLQSPKRCPDPVSNPDHFTPCKCMRFLGVGLASTSSGSFLVTKPKATHLDIGKTAAPVFEQILDKLQEPDWSILQCSAQCVELTVVGTKAKNLPKKLKRPPKPNPKEPDDKGDENDNETEDDEL